jgi:phage shock protein C
VTPGRLTRCRHDKQLAGVASGMAEYLGMDPTVVRILWILSVFFGGFTILLYIILAFVMPLEPAYPATVAGAGWAGGPVGQGGSGDPAAMGATNADGSPVDPTVTNAWTVPGHATYAPEPHEHRQHGEGRLGLGVGVLLVVFGSIALFGSALPGWVSGIALGPAFLVALGIAFVVIAVRRPATES